MGRSISFSAAEAARSLGAPRWWEPAALRTLLSDSAATLIGHDAGPDPKAPDWAFLAADLTAAHQPELRTMRRFLVQLRARAVICLDVAIGTGPVDRRIVPGPGTDLVHTPVLTGSGDADDEHLYLDVLAARSTPVAPIRSVDLAGARAGSSVVMFHTAPVMNRSAVFFDLEAPGRLDYLVVGLAPGGWDLWMDGYLEQTGLRVAPKAGTLTWKGDAGNFFLRRR